MSFSITEQKLFNKELERLQMVFLGLLWEKLQEGDVRIIKPEVTLGIGSMRT